MRTLTPKYGLWTAVAMIVGIVIGSGIFFKADDVLVASGGSLPIALLAWLIGGLIMVVSVFSFSFAAEKVSKSNGLVDYVEAGFGSKVGYYVGWYLTWVYYPTLVGVLAWVSGLYSTVLFSSGTGDFALWIQNLNGNIPDPSNVLTTWIFAGSYMLGAFALNYFSPKLAGHFQVSAMVIKLIPISLVAVVGTFAGVLNGVTLTNFVEAAQVVTQDGGGLAIAVLATAFAYDGWIAVTTINGELKDARRNLPKAFVISSAIIIGAYMLYNLGLSSVISNQVFVDQGNGAISTAVNTLFGGFAGAALTVFVVVSCLGTLNGLTLGATRGLYSIAVRNKGFAPDVFTQVNVRSNSPMASTIGGLVISLVWAIVWYGNFQGWWGAFLDTSELPIAMIYAIFILVYVWIMKDFKEAGIVKRFVFPLLATAGSIYFVFAAVQKPLFLVFLGIVAAVMLLAVIAEFLPKKPRQA